MVGESNQNVFLIQIDPSSFAELEISEFEISRVDCNFILNESENHILLSNNSHSINVAF